MKINGSLLFDASSASEIQNLRIQKFTNFAAVPAYQTADAGRMVFAQDTGIIYYGSSATGTWVAIATGGNAAALQTEVDNTQTSIGPAVNADGTFNAAGIPDVTGAITGATSITNAINQLATSLNANNELSELDDVTLGSLTDGQFLRYNTGTSRWVNHTLVLANVTDVTVPVAELNLLTGLTATSAEINILDGVVGTTTADLSSIAGYALEGVSATEFGYLDGVTSPIQDQLDDKQPLDADLTSVAALASTGIVVRSAADTFVTRTLQAPAAGITISNAAGLAGDPTFALADDLAAYEGLTGSGYVVRTGDGTATTRSHTGASGRIVVTNGDGVASNTDIDLATVTDGGTGTFLKFTRDTYGRVSGTEAVAEGDITALVDGVYVDVAGDTMTGNLTVSTGAFIILDEPPVAAKHAANKAYVDALQNGLSWKQAVRAATTGDITLSAPQTIDGVAVVANDRVLVKDQTAPAENGIYTVAAGAWVRAFDMDDAAEFDGSATFVQEGAINEGTGWTQTQTVTTVDTSDVVFSQFSGGQAFIWGTGLGNTGNTVFVNLGAGISELPSDEIGLDIVANRAVQLTSTATGGQLTFVLDGAGLEQSALGLKISDNGVTNAMLLNEFIAFNADSGSVNSDLGSTLIVAGTSTQGINTSITGNTLTITAANASASQKGVASFDATEFSVTAGNVVLGTIGNNKLANSTLNFIGTDASADTVALGESLTFASAVTDLTSVAVAANVATIGIRLAGTGATTGVASFDSNHFSVTAGAVSLDATLDDLTNVAGADSAATGDLLTKGATDWEPVTRAALANSIDLGDLGNVGASAPTAGYVLSGTGTEWISKKIYHVETVTTAATTWTVTHGLGTQFCNVTIVDATDEVVIPQSITFTSATVVTVTFNTAIAGKCVVMGIAV